MELESAQQRPKSIRDPEAMRCSRPMADDKSATFARLVVDRCISTKPRSLGATGIRCRPRDASMGELTNFHRGCHSEIGRNKPVLGPP